MDGFSVISLTSLTSTISNRALSAVEDVDELTKTPEPHHAAVALARLSTLSALLRDLDRHAAQLETALHGASALSQRLQAELSRSLGSCDAVVAGLSKQVSGLQGDNVARVDAGALGVQGCALEAYGRLFELFVKMLCMPDKVAQDGVLDSVEGRTVLGQACVASEQASQGDMLLSGRDYGTGNSSRAPLGATTEPPPYEKAASSSSLAPAPTPAPTPSSSGFAKGMSSLTHSLKAMTASLWPKPDPLATAFCQAALRGDVQQMSGFLAQGGANIDGRNGEGNTPLGCAILANQVDAVQFLLAAGADTAASSGSSKLPPLFLAASAGSGEVVKLLLSRGADVHQKSWTGQSYFVEVAEGGDVEGVGLLLTGGASANAKNLSGRPVVAQAVKKGNLELAGLLLRHGADANSTDINGNSLLALASSSDRVDLVRLLLSHGASATGRLLTGHTLLVDAVNKRRSEIASLLLDHGADANARDLFGNPILVAVLKDRQLSVADKASTARLLLRHGASPDVADATWGVYAICYALETGSADLVRALLEGGASADRRMRTGETLLLWALDGNKGEQQARLLVEHGADPNAADKKGRTPLMQAISRGNVPLIKVLRSHGADVNLGGCVSPLDLAGVMRNPEIFKALGIKVKSPGEERQEGQDGQDGQSGEAASGRPDSPPPGYRA